MAIRGLMKNLVTTNVLLLIIAIALIAIAVKPLQHPHPTQAQTQTQSDVDVPYPFYIQPGVQSLRSPDGTIQVYGMVAVDLRDGKVWGFPTSAQASYPVDIGSTKPAVSHPFLLGTFAFADTDK